MQPLTDLFNQTNISIRCDIRTGDTTSYKKQKIYAHPPDILITTPESLSVCLANTKFIKALNLEAIIYILYLKIKEVLI